MSECVHVGCFWTFYGMDWHFETLFYGDVGTIGILMVLAVFVTVRYQDPVISFENSESKGES